MPMKESMGQENTQAFVMGIDSRRSPKGSGWGRAPFNYEAASDKFTVDPKALRDRENASRRAVKAKDDIFDPYQKRRMAPAQSEVET
jgi:hypothetical protein